MTNKLNETACSYAFIRRLDYTVTQIDTNLFTASLDIARSVNFQSNTLDGCRKGMDSILSTWGNGAIEQLATRLNTEVRRAKT